MPILAAAAFQGSPLWKVTPSRRWKRHRFGSISSQRSTPLRGTTSKVVLSIQVRGSLAKSSHTRLGTFPLQPEDQAPNWSGPVLVTKTTVSLAEAAAPGVGVGAGVVVGASAAGVGVDSEGLAGIGVAVGSE